MYSRFSNFINDEEDNNNYNSELDYSNQINLYNDNINKEIDRIEREKESNKLKNSFEVFNNEMINNNFIKLQHNYFMIGYYYYNYETREMIFFNGSKKRTPSDKEYLDVLLYNNIN